jgi:NADH:ubiquinone oxidoreductase subunit E
MIDTSRVEAIVDSHGRQKEHLIAMLLDCQDEFRYLPRELLETVANRVGVSITSVLGIATFYRGFSLKPVGKHPICVCTGTACHVLGAQKLMAAFERELGVKQGDTTPDGMFSLHAVNCPGCCGLAPVITVGQDVHGKVTQVKIPRIIKRYRERTEG